MKIYVHLPGAEAGASPTELSLDPQSTIVTDLKKAAQREVSKSDSFDEQVLETFYVSVEGRPLDDETLTLAAAGIAPGATIRCEGRLRGGALVNLKIHSKFGCVCCNNHCTYDCCRRGRIYDVRVSNIQDVSTILASIAEQNAQWSVKKPSPVIFTKANVVLDPERKILFYDLKDGDELTMYLSPSLWFTKDFRKGGMTKDEQDEEAEIQRRIAAKQAAADKGLMTDPKLADERATVDVEAMAS